MRYATAGAFRTALEDRLRARASHTGVPLVRLRKLVVFDRLMARLMVVAHERWVLKGAVALQWRVGPDFRTTRDLDLGRPDSEEAATADFVAAQSADLGDHFTFGIERTTKLDALLEGAAVRYQVKADLAGRRFEGVTVDIALGDPVVGEPEMLLGPDLLAFADVLAAHVAVLPLEQHVAEKVHAYTRDYGPDRVNTRVKDLIDLVLISRLLSPRASALVEALERIFGSRNSHPLPTSLPPPSQEWRVPYARMASEVGMDRDVMMGLQQAKALLDPVLSGSVARQALWDPSRRVW